MHMPLSILLTHFYIVFGSNASKYIQTKHFRTGYLESISNVNGRRPMTLIRNIMRRIISI